MCELIISVVDRGDEIHWVKRGTVIEVFEDGHDYGAQELAHPMFRILKLPGVPVAFGRSFLGSELPPINQHQPSYEKMHRQFKLDLDHASVPDDLKAHLADDKRTDASYTVDLNRWSLDAIEGTKVKRTRPTDSSIIGNPHNIIG